MGALLVSLGHYSSTDWLDVGDAGMTGLNTLESKTQNRELAVQLIANPRPCSRMDREFIEATLGCSEILAAG